VSCARERRSPSGKRIAKKVFLGTRSRLSEGFCDGAHHVGSAEHDRVRRLSVSQVASPDSHPRFRNQWRHGGYEVAAQWKTVWRGERRSRGAPRMLLRGWRNRIRTAGPRSGNDAQEWCIARNASRFANRDSIRRDILFDDYRRRRRRLAWASAFVAENPEAKCAEACQHRSSR